MKKVSIVSLVSFNLGLLLLAGVHPARAWKNTFIIPDNRFEYVNFLRPVTSKPEDYLARITRAGITYRDVLASSNYVAIGTEDLGNPASPWRYGDDMNLATSDGAPGEWAFVLYQPGNHFLKYRLSDEQLGFANLSFAYGGLAFTEPFPRLPTLAVDVCGQIYTFEPDLATGEWQTAILPNPGCNETQRELHFYPLDESAITSEQPLLLSISRLTFDAVHLSENDQVCWRRRDAAPLALFERQHQVCTAATCCAGAPAYDVALEVSDYWLGDVDASGEAISTTTPGEPFAAAALPLDVQITIDHVSQEPDQTLSVSAHWTDPTATYAPVAWELGITTVADQLAGDWDTLTHVPANSRADFHALTHVSSLSRSGVANFTLPPEISWENGFFWQLRLRDAYDQYSPGSEIYHCHAHSCQRSFASPTPQAYLSEIIFPQASGEALVRITLPDNDTSVDTLLLADGLEQGDSLAAGQRDGSIVTLTRDDLARESVHLRLYDQKQNQLLDAIDRDFVPAGLSLIRNPYTKQWKENYVRN